MPKQEDKPKLLPDPLILVWASALPLLSVIIGEGGSGGAIAIATADRLYMLEHAIYSVISPEGCASILWRSAEQAEEAAEALKLTAQDLLSLKLIDGIISEPLGGAHCATRRSYSCCRRTTRKKPIRAHTLGF
jgi:acetyl-CoA carboxylase alpha subunit